MYIYIYTCTAVIIRSLHLFSSSSNRLTNSLLITTPSNTPFPPPPSFQGVFLNVLLEIFQVLLCAEESAKANACCRLLVKKHWWAGFDINFCRVLTYITSNSFLLLKIFIEDFSIFQKTTKKTTFVSKQHKLPQSCCFFLKNHRHQAVLLVLLVAWSNRLKLT